MRGAPPRRRPDIDAARERTKTLQLAPSVFERFEFERDDGLVIASVELGGCEDAPDAVRWLTVSGPPLCHCQRRCRGA